MKYTTLSFLIVLLGCQEKTTQLSYHMLNFRKSPSLYSEYGKVDTVDFSYNRINGDTTQLHYMFKDGRRSYFFPKGSGNGFISTLPRDSFLHGSDTAYFLRCISDTFVTLDNHSIHLRKFILDEDVQDGASIHYFCDSIGVYAIHSDTWPGISMVQSNDSAFNFLVLRLVKQQVPDFFIRPPLTEMIK